jgi:hypothetical protein
MLEILEPDAPSLPPAAALEQREPVKHRSVANRFERREQA